MRCARCGKEFSVSAEGWGYAFDGKYTCSYKCMREMEKEDGKKMSEKAKRVMTDEDRAKIDELAGQGFDSETIAKTMGLSQASVGGYLGRKKRMAAQSAKEQPKESATVPQIWADIGKEVPECDELTRMVVRLMADMVTILKRIV